MVGNRSNTVATTETLIPIVGVESAPGARSGSSVLNGDFLPSRGGFVPETHLKPREMIHPGRPFQPGQSGNPAGRVDGRRYRSIVDNLSAEVRRRTGRAPGAGALCIIGEVAVLASSRKGDRVRAARAIADLLGRLGLDLKPEPTKPPSLDEYLRRRRKAAGASVTGSGPRPVGNARQRLPTSA